MILSKHIQTIKNEVTKPKKDRTWTLREVETEITDDKAIAEIFNNYFIQNIENLKDTIDETQSKDPTKRLREKFKNRNLKFSLITGTEDKVKGAEIIAIPLI